MTVKKTDPKDEVRRLRKGGEMGKAAKLAAKLDDKAIAEIVSEFPELRDLISNAKMAA